MPTKINVKKYFYRYNPVPAQLLASRKRMSNSGDMIDSDPGNSFESVMASY